MEDIQTLMQLSDEELLRRLGHEQSSHAAPATPQSLISDAKQWLKKNLIMARSGICGNPVVDAIRKKSDEVTLVGAIADIFAKSFGFPVPAVVAILAVRIGLDRLCDGKQTPGA